MQRSNFLWMLVFVVAVFGAVGCADPSKGKHEAVVGDAAPAPGDLSGKLFAISDESKVNFTGSKVTGKHDGGFNAFSGEITLVGGTPLGSSVKLDIDTTSLWTDSERLTGHLKSGDFFDVEAHPQATFESTSIEAADDGFTVTGNLNLHGVTKSISFPADIEVSDMGIKAQAEFTIQRFDFDIAYKGKADDLIRDGVVISFNLIAFPAEG